MEIDLKFSFSFRPESVIDDCSHDDDEGTYRRYGCEIERVVERVMRFIRSYSASRRPNEMLALTSGYRACPQGSVQMIKASQLEEALVGWFTIIFFSCSLTYSRAKKEGKAIGLAGGHVLLKAEQYGGVHLQIVQYEGNDDYVERQSLDILGVKHGNDATLGAELRKKMPGKAGRLSVVASPF